MCIGIALTGDPNYGIITEAYPFVARKLLSEDRPEIQKALYAVLYANNGDDKSLRANRLSVLLNSALGGKLPLCTDIHAYTHIVITNIYLSLFYIY